MLQYLESCEGQRLPTLPGLALALGFSSRGELERFAAAQGGRVSQLLEWAASWVEEELPVGTPVLIVEVDEETNICTVCPFDSYQKQLRQYKKSFTHTKGGY